MQQILEKGDRLRDVMFGIESLHECRGRAVAAGRYGRCWAQKRQVRTYFCLEGDDYEVMIRMMMMMMTTTTMITETTMI
jgi:hypothetical protein